MDNGKESGNYYLRFRVYLGFATACRNHTGRHGYFKQLASD